MSKHKYQTRRAMMTKIDTILKAVCGDPLSLDKRTISLVDTTRRDATYRIRHRDSDKIYTFTVNRSGDLVSHDGEGDQSPCNDEMALSRRSGTYTRFKFAFDIRKVISAQLGDSRNYDLRSLKVVETSSQGVLYSVRPRWAKYQGNKYRKYFFVSNNDRSA